MWYARFQFRSEEHLYRWPNEGLHTLWLGVSRRQLSPWYPQGRSRDYLDWIHNENSASSFFWLYGPAGTGTTAILQAIAEFLCSPSKSAQNFWGSFFFSRGKNGHDRGHFLFSTIASQLALNVPGLRQHVNRIVELNPTLRTKSMDVQLRTLIVDAFQYLSSLSQRSYLDIIDGLDECHDKATQQLILRLLCETITAHKLPLWFLIRSHPEFHIRDSFDQESLYIVTRRVVLDETFDLERKRCPGVSARWFCEDLCQEFHSVSCRVMAWGRHYWSPRATIIWSVHLRCYCPQICWCLFLQSLR